MQTVLNVVAKFDHGYGKILDSLKSQTCVDKFREELNADLINGKDIDEILEEYNFKRVQGNASVESIEVMSTEEYCYLMRAYKISLPASEITLKDYNEYYNLLITKTKNQGNEVIIGTVESGFISKARVDEVSLDLNIGTNCFINDGKYFKKFISLTDAQSWVI